MGDTAAPPWHRRHRGALRYLAVLALLWGLHAALVRALASQDLVAAFIVALARGTQLTVLVAGLALLVVRFLLIVVLPPWGVAVFWRTIERAFQGITPPVRGTTITGERDAVTRR